MTNIDPEILLKGGLNASAENDAQGFGDSVKAILMEQPALFFRELKKLEPLYVDLLLSYLIVGKTQVQLAKIFNLSQRYVNVYLREALEVIGANMLFGEYSTGDIQATLERCKVEKAASNAKIVKFLLVVKSRRAFKEEFGAPQTMFAPMVRTLRGSGDQKGVALAAVIYQILSSTHKGGAGYRSRQQDVYLVDNPFLESPRIPIENCKGVFTPRSAGFEDR